MRSSISKPQNPYTISSPFADNRSKLGNLLFAQKACPKDQSVRVGLQLSQVLYPQFRRVTEYYLGAASVHFGGMIAPCASA
jgi:hypothetical protein